MTGFLCAVGIFGAIAFTIGWMDDDTDWLAYPLVFGGGLLLVVASIGGIVRIFI